MTTTFVICEHRYNCDNSECSFTHPYPGGAMDEAMCGHVGKRVNIIEYQEVPTCNPNYLFRERKRDGL